MLTATRYVHDPCCNECVAQGERAREVLEESSADVYEVVCYEEPPAVEWDLFTLRGYMSPEGRCGARVVPAHEVEQ